MRLERLREQVVQIHLVSLVNARDGDRAAIALATGACRLALDVLAGALSLDGGGSLRLSVRHFGKLPVLERRMARGEVSHPDARTSDHLLVYAILIVFLLMRVEEEVETGQIAEAHKLCERRALLVSQRLEELVVQVADLLLCDGAQRVNRVEPGVQSGLLGQLLEARVLEVARVLHPVDLLHKLGTLGHHILIIGAEVHHVLVEVFQGRVALRLQRSVRQGSQCSQQEIASVEAGSHHDSI